MLVYWTVASSVFRCNDCVVEVMNVLKGKQRNMYIMSFIWWFKLFVSELRVNEGVYLYVHTVGTAWAYSCVCGFTFMTFLFQPLGHLERATMMSFNARATDSVFLKTGNAIGTPTAKMALTNTTAALQGRVAPTISSVTMRTVWHRAGCATGKMIAAIWAMRRIAYHLLSAAL